MMQFDFGGRTALVTGGSSGIGEGVARALARGGARVAIMGRRGAEVERVASEIGGLAIAGDVRSGDDAHRAVATCVADLGGLHMLVNSAGVIGNGTTAEGDVDEWRHIMETNLDGTVNLCRAAIGELRRSAAAGKGASIVNVSSVTGTRPFHPITAYCVSKAAVDMFTRCLALELAPDRVRVNAVAPGVVVTNLHTVTGAVTDYPAFLERGKATHPLGFVGEPRDVAAMTLYLLSDEARWVTGGIFPIDGGRALMSAR